MNRSARQIPSKDGSKGVSLEALPLSTFQEIEEGIVHGSCLAALEKLGMLTPDKAQEILRDALQKPFYGQIPASYERAKREGAREFFTRLLKEE